MIITLLGYGLVAVPRNWWNYGNLEDTLDYLAMKAFVLDESLVEAKYQLDQLVGKVLSLSNQIAKDIPLRECYEIMVGICPEASVQHNKATSGYRTDSRDVINEKMLINLHLMLKNEISDYNRSKWYIVI